MHVSAARHGWTVFARPSTFPNIVIDRPPSPAAPAAWSPPPSPPPSPPLLTMACMRGCPYVTRDPKFAKLGGCAVTKGPRRATTPLALPLPRPVWTTSEAFPQQLHLLSSSSPAVGSGDEEAGERESKEGSGKSPGVLPGEETIQWGPGACLGAPTRRVFESSWPGEPAASADACRPGD
ncbi:uncharacterized protein LOC134765216 [Penaeus indicus]|uniref:uncharacterized protein LOC134765216 n=1 Tax=Penaeus indicus TaxID=29960 RepID=UPI00300C6CCA